MQENQTVKVRLDSWKAITSHLGRDVRTVIRWEKKGLPVHRVPGGHRKAVFAYISEIDTWLVSQEASGNDVFNGSSESPDTESADEEKQIAENSDLTVIGVIRVNPAGETVQRSRVAAAIQAIRVNKWKVSVSAGLLGLTLLAFLGRPKKPALLHPIRLERLTSEQAAHDPRISRAMYAPFRGPLS